MGLQLNLLRGQAERASTSSRAPLARSTELVIEELDGELLVYDETSARAHCLSKTAARVWRACDGATDIEAISAKLDLSADTVLAALAELEQTQLLETQGLRLLDGSGNGSRITRRELTMRSAKVGTVVAAAPLILSIVAPTPAAAATPTPFQCQLYTTQDCGTSSGCASIAGCCCCCQSGGSCKVCSSVNFCNAGLQSCIGGGTGAKCSSVGTSGASPAGCCGVSGAKQCGCGWGTGGGCCLSTTHAACTPGDANCVPCCNGTPIKAGSQIGCCSSNTGTGTCVV